MRKIFWVSWCFLILVFVGSYFRSAAIEYQYSNTLWLQLAIADGGVRGVTVRGDTLASWTANLVIQRDKDGWRYHLSTAPWGKVAYWESSVDTKGTLVGERRIDIPCLVLLFILLACILTLRAMKRWWVPPRLVWLELGNMLPLQRGLFGYIRRTLLIASMSLTIISSLLWACSYLNPLPGWRYLGERFALVMGRDYDDHHFYELINRADYGTGGFRKAYAEINNKRIEEFGKPELFYSVEVTRERIAFSHFVSRIPTGITSSPSKLEFAGMIFQRNRATLPGAVSPFSHSLRPKMGAGLERTVILRLWMLVLLFGFWPLLCFFCGPVRRARRRVGGCCPPCGYNLTGLTERRCPECGTSF